ncbi:MAG: hypothetical protein J7M26_01675, partial [Armatimonadetes bacterium]|nr:hypothetical protein [Armatimonadota bacterium]
ERTGNIVTLTAPDVRTWQRPLAIKAALVRAEAGPLAPRVAQPAGVPGPLAVWEVALGSEARQVDLVVLFSEDTRALEGHLQRALASPETYLAGTRDYFDDLLQHTRVKTPAAALDQAFAWAILNMEYTYYSGPGVTEKQSERGAAGAVGAREEGTYESGAAKGPAGGVKGASKGTSEGQSGTSKRAGGEAPEPAETRGAPLLGLGWIECLHHWVGFFQPVHTAAADTLGQWDRSRAVLENSARILDSTGRAMDFMPSGFGWRAFAWDQYFQWGVRHLWRATGDRELLRRLWPAVKRNMVYVRRTWDRDNNGLFGFNEQIGWQEDYLYSYEDSGSASLAFADIERGLVAMAEACGDQAAADKYAEVAARSRSALRQMLWEPRLGRFINYRDRLGVKHWEGQYHTFCWPGYLGLVDDLDAHTSARHLLAVLTTPRGLVYVSNNFPTHAPATVGTQEGSAQSAFAALALARQGWAEEAASILAREGELIIKPPLSGAFPETMPLGPSWFSAPAAAYAQAVVEGLFGLERNLPQGRVELCPALPPQWQRAEITLPWLRAQYSQSPTQRRVRLELKEELGVHLRWWLPPARVPEISDRGHAVPFQVRPGPGRVLVEADLPPARKHDLVVKMSPRAWAVHYDERARPGQLLRVRVEGCRVVGVEDREGLCRSARITVDGALLRLREDLLQGFEAFGDWGRTQFLDRTVFLKVLADGVSFFVPVELRLVPGPLPPNPSDQVRQAEIEKRFSWEDVPLPAEVLQPSARWRAWRQADDLGHQPWASEGDPLAGVKELLGDDGRIPVPGRKLSFAAPAGKAAPVSNYLGKRSVVVPVRRLCRGLALLVLPVLYNEDVFSQVGEVIVRTRRGETFRRPLYFPGDLDWMHAPEAVGAFATLGKGWSRSPAVHCKTAVFSVVEIPLAPARDVTSVELVATGEHPALALVAVAGLTVEQKRWEEVAGLPPEQISAQILLGDFEDGTLGSWQAEGKAWGVSEAGGYFHRYGTGRYFADSRAGGESATGTLTSPVFVVVKPWLSWYADGWSAGGQNYFALVDAETGEVLLKVRPPNHTGVFPLLTRNVSSLLGRRVRFIAVDGCTKNAYAWLAFDHLLMSDYEPGLE